MTYESDTLATPGRGKSLIRQFLERKQMSTKTTFKRVALVAAAALTLGGISGVAAHATTLSQGYVNIFTPDGSSAVSSSQTATGWSVSQVASGSGYVGLAGTTDVNGAALESSLSLSGEKMTSLSTNFAGASSVSATPASVTLEITTPGTFLQRLFGTGVGTTMLTVSGTSLSASGTTVTAGVDSADNTELTAADLLAGFSGLGTGATLTVADGGSFSTAGLSPLTAAALAPYFPAGSISGGAVISVTAASNAEIKVSTPTASTVSGVTIANLAATSNLGTINASAPLETFNVTVTAGQAAATLASISVTAANGTGTFVDVTGKGTSFVDPSGDTGYLAITSAATNSNGVANTNPLLAPALTYSVSGVGLLGGNPGTTYVAVSANTYTGSNQVNLYSDGRAGTSTVTVTANGVVVGTISVVFYGKVASVTVVPLISIAKAGATAGALNDGSAISGNVGFEAASAINNPAVAVVLKDASGNIVPNSTGLSMTSSAPTVVYSGIPSSFVDNGLGAGAVAFGYVHTTYAAAYGAASGSKATLTYSYQNSDGTIVTSTPVSVSIGGSVAKETISLDAASYTAGAPMTLTATAVDSAGNPVYDGAAGAALTANKSIVGLPSIKYSGGKFSSTANTLFAPATPGDFTIYGAGADAASTAYTVTATVGNDAADAASLATDAANAATDAANAAAESADNATQAASDALAAVQSLQSYVSKLFAGVKKEIAALLKLVHALKK